MDSLDVAIKSVEDILQKTKIRAYTRRGKGGKLISVQAHEDSRQALQRTMTGMQRDLSVATSPTERGNLQSAIGKIKGQLGQSQGGQHRVEFNGSTYKVVKPNGEYVKTVGGQIWEHPDLNVAQRVMNEYATRALARSGNRNLNQFPSQSVPEQHRARIAAQTRKMPKAMRGVM